MLVKDPVTTISILLKKLISASLQLPKTAGLRSLSH